MMVRFENFMYGSLLDIQNLFEWISSSMLRPFCIVWHSKSLHFKYVIVKQPNDKLHRYKYYFLEQSDVYVMGYLLHIYIYKERVFFQFCN